MHVLVGGASGFIGRHLARHLRDRGHKVTAISRFEGEDTVTWQQLYWNKGIPEDINAVVNLTGNRFMKWNSWWDRNDLTILSGSAIQDWEISRIKTAQMCVSYINERQKNGDPIDVYVQGSGYWYYHVNDETQNNIWSEFDKGGEADLISKLTKKWEESSQLPEDVSTRRVIIRSGNVLSPESGLMKDYLVRSKCFFGGPIIKGGANPLNWVHMEDHVGIIEHALTNQNVDGILNSVAPELVDHAEFARLIAHQTKRPNWYTPSRLMMDYTMGPERTKLLTESAWIQPERTLQSGYHFKYTNLSFAVPDLCSRIPKGYLTKTLYKDMRRFCFGYEDRVDDLRPQDKQPVERFTEILLILTALALLRAFII